MARKSRDIEDLLVWAFRDQKIEHVADSLKPKGPARSSASSLGELLQLGTRVDRSSAGTMHLAARCHEDAAVIYDAVMRLPPDQWLMLVKHARSATQPEWWPEGPGQWVRPLDKRGEPKKLYLDPSRRQGFIGLAPLELVGMDPQMVEADRLAYRLWQGGLTGLVDIVNAEMVDHEALPPSALARPWETGAIEEPV